MSERPRITSSAGSSARRRASGPRCLAVAAGPNGRLRAQFCKTSVRAIGAEGAKPITEGRTNPYPQGAVLRARPPLPMTRTSPRSSSARPASAGAGPYCWLSTGVEPQLSLHAMWLSGPTAHSCRTAASDDRTDCVVYWSTQRHRSRREVFGRSPIPPPRAPPERDPS
jgi:hypothetical protein